MKVKNEKLRPRYKSFLTSNFSSWSLASFSKDLNFYIASLTGVQNFMRFKDRQEAGRLLAEALKEYQGKDVVVYALPRGGVVLGVEIASFLQVPLDLIIVRKVGHPYSPEYAICGVSENGYLICNEEELSQIDSQWLKEAIESQRAEAKRRKDVYLSGKEPLSSKGKMAILVDDGIATGLTVLAAVEEVKHQNPKEIVVAVPVIPKEVAIQLKEVNKIVALDIDENFLGSVGAYYKNFPQVSDEEVIELMRSVS